MDKILITGGSGLVGRCFEGDNYVRFRSSEIDLKDKKQADYIVEATQPDGIIHCAAKVGGVLGNMNYKGEFFYDNIMINTNIIEAARKNNVKKLVAFLSTCVFPDKVTYPLTVDQVQLGEPHTSNYPYAYAKRMADVQIRAYREQYGLNYFSVIPTNVYGIGDNFHLQDSHVLPALIHKALLAKENGTDLAIWGSGEPLREFIFNEDLAHLVKLLYDNYTGEEPVILSSSEEIAIKDVVGLVVDAIGFKGKVVFDKEKPDGQFRKPSDNSVIKNMFPEFKFTPLETGIQKTVDWFVSNYPNVRI